MEEEQEAKIKRYTVWAVLLIILGGLASYMLPEESRTHFFQLLSDIITNLIAI